VNAYADPASNEVAFPAAILAGRFFDPEADDAANYGAILVVILHEFGHLFDDSGAKYDADGNVKMQWTESDFAHFMERVQKIRTQFGRLTVGKNKVPVKGNLVSGEAAADLNGVNLAYRALQRRLEKTGRRVIDGFDDEQRFFIAYAQIWASICTPEYVESQVKGDPHPPEIFRVNATLANVSEFPAAFGLPDDCAIMLPVQERCHIW
jgi:putative endopeptidase